MPCLWELPLSLVEGDTHHCCMGFLLQLLRSLYGTILMCTAARAGEQTAGNTSPVCLAHRQVQTLDSSEGFGGHVLC